MILICWLDWPVALITVHFLKLSLLLARLVEAVLDSPGPPVPPASPLMLEPASEAVGVTGAERLLTFVKALSNLCINASASVLFIPNAAAAVRYGTL